MCGRFALGIPRKVLEEHLAPGVPETFRESFNIAPSGTAPSGIAPFGRIPVWEASGWTMRPWGIVLESTDRGGNPARNSAKNSAQNQARPRRIINARSETMFEKPLFRRAAAQARCLVPAQAFYEWKTGAADKIPYAFMMNNAPVFTMAGILVRASHDSEPALVIATCAANSVVAPVHNRMPVILSPEVRSLWLDPHADQDTLRRLPAPFDSAHMHGYPVSPAVNAPSFDTPSCLTPVVHEPVQANLLDF